MGVDKIVDLTAGWGVFNFYNIKRLPTCILNEDTHPVIRAIGVSHTACKDDFRKIFDLTAAVYFYFYATREKDKYKV